MWFTISTSTHTVIERVLLHRLSENGNSTQCGTRIPPTGGYMVSKYRSKIHPKRDVLPDGTEIRLVLPLERTGNRHLYVTASGRAFSHVRVKDKKTGVMRWIYREQVLFTLTPGKLSVNANRKQRYYIMPHHGDIYLHIAVCLAWNGPCPNGYECDHLNGIVSDNRASNLQWVTPAENRKRAVILRARRMVARQDNDPSKLPENMKPEELLELFSMYNVAGDCYEGE